MRAGCRRASPDYVERLVAPYFEAVAEWYEALRIGLPGGALQEIIDRRLGDPFFGIFLNPGHLLHLDEWLELARVTRLAGAVALGHGVPGRHHPGDRDRLFHHQHRGRHRPRGRGAPRRARGALSGCLGAHPGTTPIHARSLGITLQPEVLPLLNIPAYLPPFLLRPDHVMTLLDT